MEFPAFSSRAGRRSLHRRRSLLFDAQGHANRLPPGNDSAGRRINDGMGAYVAQQVVMLMTERRIMVGDARILILGLAFKENCPDLRNSKVIDIVNELKRFDANVDVHDPWVDANGAHREY